MTLVRNQMPSFAEENLLREQGYQFIAGVDEVGRGALMGPVVAAAVILPDNIETHWRDGVRDSKQLTPAKRYLLYDHIHEIAVSVGIGVSSSDIVDECGVAQATRIAMKLAINQLVPEPQFLLVDYMFLPGVLLPQKGITDGDSLCFSIACASIIAKVTRDRMAVEMDRDYPGYGFAVHKGYGTKEHLECLRRKGPCPLHRRSFRPVREIMGLMI